MLRLLPRRPPVAVSARDGTTAPARRGRVSAVPVDQLLTLAVASVAAFGLALLSAVAGFGGGVLLLPVFTVLFGLRVAVPMLTLTQLSSNGFRAWLNRRELRRPLIGWFA